MMLLPSVSSDRFRRGSMVMDLKKCEKRLRRGGPTVAAVGLAGVPPDAAVAAGVAAAAVRCLSVSVSSPFVASPFLVEASVAALGLFFPLPGAAAAADNDTPSPLCPALLLPLEWPLPPPP